MALSGTQITLVGIVYAQKLNVIAAIIWAIVLVVLVYYSWIGRGD